MGKRLTPREIADHLNTTLALQKREREALSKLKRAHNAFLVARAKLERFLNRISEEKK